MQAASEQAGEIERGCSEWAMNGMVGRVEGFLWGK
jgi:hypothetical protein